MNFKSQIAPKGLQFNPSDFFISDHYATILTVVSYPKYIQPGYLSSLTNMPGIKVKDNESLDNALARFKKQCAKYGVLAEIRKREHYEKPSVKRKKKSEAARKRKH